MVELPNEKNSKDNFDENGSDLDENQNFVGFFSLLLEIDKRNNPHFYKKPEIKNNNTIINSKTSK